MQPNTVTLAVDLLNTGATTNVVFTRHEELTNRSTYRSPSHSLASRDILQLYRTAPTRSGDFLGAAKTTVKFTQDVAVDNASGTGTLTAPLIVEINFSVPVGTPDAEILVSRQRAIALLDMDTVMVPLNSLQEI
jgi:hypothetical protein